MSPDPAPHDTDDDLRPIEVTSATAVVTGGASGIGRGIVGALLRAGATVVIADIEQSAIDTTLAELSTPDTEGRLSGIRTDITDESSVKLSLIHI